MGTLDDGVEDVAIGKFDKETLVIWGGFLCNLK